jgi:hypothetical protein
MLPLKSTERAEGVEWVPEAFWTEGGKTASTAAMDGEESVVQPAGDPMWLALAGIVVLEGLRERVVLRATLSPNADVRSRMRATTSGSPHAEL